MTSSTIFCGQCGASNQSQAAFCFACGQPLSSSNMTGLLATGSMLKQRYRLVRQVGQGGFGAVYAAEDTQLGDRLVAVKEMSQRGLSSQELQEATDAFQREAHLLAKLRHPNLPAIYDYFSESGRWYLVMEFIEGETLESSLAKAPGGCLPVQKALELGLQLCTVLDYLHTHHPPIIFRDLKPANIMVTPKGEVYLIDFGIARHFKPGQAKDTTAFGSAGFAAPEQYGKTQTTTQSDIYSLGATLHQVISGSDPADHPFVFAPLRLNGPVGFEPLILQMLESDQSKRPASMAVIKQQMQQMLATWTTSGPIMGSSPRPSAAGFGQPPGSQSAPPPPRQSGGPASFPPQYSASSARGMPHQGATPNRYAMTSPPPSAPFPRHIYSMPVLISLIVTYSASFAVFAGGGTLSENIPPNSPLMGVANALLSIGGISWLFVVPIAVLVMDARGFVTLNGFIKWRRMPILVRLIVGYFLLGLYPFLLCIYLFLAFLTYRQASALSAAPLPVTQPSPDLASPKVFFKSRTFRAVLLGSGALVVVIITLTIAAILASPTNIDPLAGRLVPVVGYLTSIPAVIYGHRTLKNQRQSYGQTPSTRIVLVGLWCGYIALGLALLTTPQAIIGPF